MDLDRWSKGTVRGSHIGGGGGTRHRAWCYSPPRGCQSLRIAEGMNHTLADAALVPYVNLRGPAPGCSRLDSKSRSGDSPRVATCGCSRTSGHRVRTKLTNLDDLEACVILDGPLEAQLGKRYVVGVDVV